MSKKKSKISNPFHARRIAQVRAAKARKAKNKKSKVLSHDNPLLDSYFKDINQYELLTRKEERELFKQYHKWRDNSRAGQATRKNGKAARERLIVANLRLVIRIANDYRHCSLPLSDLISEGNIALMKAIEKFKLRKKVKLSTYAGYWIRQAISRSLEKHSRTIRLPSHTYPLLKKINKFINEYKDEYGEEPTVAEIASETKVSESNVVNLFASGVTNVLSLNMPVGDESTDSEAIIQDMTEDFSTDQPSFLAEKSDDAEILHDFLSRLTNREKYIIMRRFGMGNFAPETLEKIALRYGISRERIRQIQYLTMRRLRRFSMETYQKTWADFVG